MFYRICKISGGAYLARIDYTSINGGYQDEFESFIEPIKNNTSNRHIKVNAQATSVPMKFERPI